MTEDNLTTNASNEAESPAFLVGAVMLSFFSLFFVRWVYFFLFDFQLVTTF